VKEEYNERSETGAFNELKTSLAPPRQGMSMHVEVGLGKKGETSQHAYIYIYLCQLRAVQHQDPEPGCLCLPTFEFRSYRTVLRSSPTCRCKHLLAPVIVFKLFMCIVLASEKYLHSVTFPQHLYTVLLPIREDA